MLSILLVDDESFIRRGLKILLESMLPGGGVFREASNGEEALKVLDEFAADLVISDIRMPVMDGLALMASHRAAGGSTEFIFLSGFDDFHYARSALKLGARDYLLKPVDSGELKKSLESALAALDQRSKARSSEDGTRFFQWLDDPRLGGEPSSTWVDSLGLREILSQPYSVYVQKVSPGHPYQVLERVPDAGAAIPMKAFPGGSYAVHIVPEGPPLALDHLPAGTVWLARSRTVTGPQALRGAVAQALEVLKYRVIRPAELLFESDALSKQEPLPAETRERLGQLSDLVGTGRLAEVRSILEAVFLPPFETTTGYLDEAAQTLFRQVIAPLLKKVDPSASLFSRTIQVLESLWVFDSVPEYLQAVMDFLEEVEHQFQSLRKVTRQASVLEIAQEWIEANHADQGLTMELVANHVGMNYSYFSFFFKEQTGTNFVHYLKKVRVEKSKALLVDPLWKINEIAARVGYVNARQFTKSFREITGILPHEYRDKHLSLG